MGGQIHGQQQQEQQRQPERRRRSLPTHSLLIDCRLGGLSESILRQRSAPLALSLCCARVSDQLSLSLSLSFALISPEQQLFPPPEFIQACVDGT